MVFSSITFLFYFLPVVLLIYYISPKKLKNMVLLLASLFFYYFAEPRYILLMLASIAITYTSGILIDKYKETEYKKVILIISIGIIIGILIYFKYSNFIIKNISLWLGGKVDFIYVILPIGISFYTFQMVSYLIDIYNEKGKLQKNVLNLALYISLFPQLIAGPIVRYSVIDEQLSNREHTVENFAIGIRKFIMGLGKKVLIANVLGELVSIFLVSNDKSVLFYWMYAISITLQIYFDFSGYSDMAIGLGRMFGFIFPENFNYPYIATSISEFWRRWHISLSTWFRDYIYIPLGGNRVSKLKWIRNILIVWVLTGLWHGAEWNFIIWGIYFGIILIIEKLFIKKFLEKIPMIFSRIYVMTIVIISFIIFSGEGYIQILDNLGGLININIPLSSLESIYYLKSYALIMICAIIGATPLMKKIISHNKIHKVISSLEPLFLMSILIISTAYIIDGSFNPFLYFRF